MDFKLTRNDIDETGVYGILSDSLGNEFCVTLEHSFQQADGSYAPKVPAGTYTCIRRLSPKFGFEVFMLQNVPGASFIEIHVGNYNADSDGCILLGTMRTGDMIANSKQAFWKFMTTQDGLNQFTLVIE